MNILIICIEDDTYLLKNVCLRYILEQTFLFYQI